MAKLHEIQYEGTIDDLAQSEISISKGAIEIDGEDFKLKGHRKLDDANRITLHELPEGGIAVEIAKREAPNGGEENQVKLVKADGTENFIDTVESENDPETKQIKAHTIGFEGNVTDLALADIEISKGKLSIDGEEFKLKGHRNLNDPNRLVFREGPEGDISVDVLKKGQDNSGQDGEVLIITAAGDPLYKDIKVETNHAPTHKAEDDSLEMKDANPASPDTPAQEPLKETPTVLFTAFDNQAQEVPDEISALIASNASDMTPAEMGDVPSELTMDSPALKQSTTVTA